MKNKYVLYGILLFLFFSAIILIPLGLKLGLSLNPQSIKNHPLPISYSPTPLPSMTSKLSSPSPTSGVQTNPPVRYNQQGQETIMQKIENRQPLSDSDQQAKNTIIGTADPTSGVVYQAAIFRVDYIQAADVFQVEIQTTDIQNAKTAAESWFTSQGISQEGICNLPLMFYLNFDIANKLQGKNTQFTPLPDGC